MDDKPASFASGGRSAVKTVRKLSRMSRVRLFSRKKKNDALQSRMLMSTNMLKWNSSTVLFEERSDEFDGA
jgi:hypothetical protein